MRISIIAQYLKLSVLLLLVTLGTEAYGEEEIWLLADTKTRILSVKQGKEIKAQFKNFAIGRNGTARDKVRNDHKTPLGIYRIGWINNNSRFYRFFGVNYPSRIDGKRGVKRRLINERTYQELLRADLFDEVPPQNTRLGGQIGIHGVGKGDRFIHDTLDWTQGCIALTNEQIDRLGSWIKKGAVVVIR